MAADDSPTVFRLHSTVEVPLEAVYEYFEDATLPEGIAEVDITRRNNTLIIAAVAADEGISKYTPTAQLKATIAEKRVPEEEPADTPPGGGGPLQWQSREDEEEIPTKLVEYAGFKGTRETVLLNTELQYPMFQVLRELATLAERGALTAIVGVEGNLETTRIVDGEERPASIEVVEEERESDAEGVDWRDNEFING